MFEYYFQIIKTLKRDLIIGLNFQRTFKILQDVTDDNDLYLHIRRKLLHSVNRQRTLQITSVHTNVHK